MTNAVHGDGHSHDEDAMVGLATQLVRVMGVDNVQSYAGYIADFVVLSWLEYLMQSSHGFDDDGGDISWT